MARVEHLGQTRNPGALGSAVPAEAVAAQLVTLTATTAAMKAGVIELKSLLSVIMEQMQSQTVLLGRLAAEGGAIDRLCAISGDTQRLLSDHLQLTDVAVSELRSNTEALRARG